MNRRAFTLLELMAVIAILGLIGSAVGVSLTDAAARSRVQTTIQQIKSFDSQCRRLARAHGSGEAAFNVYENTATFSSSESTEAISNIERTFASSIRSIDVIGQTVPVQSVRFAPNGTSPSYVVELDAADSRSTRRLLVAGGTGHTQLVEEGVRVDSYPH